MDLTKIVSISGYPEVFKVIKEARKGVIVESLLTGKRMQAFLTQKITSLEDIAIFTSKGDIKLKEVFRKIYEKENGNKAPEPKNISKQEIVKYFEQVLPEYDKDRVYISDMKKVLRWYNLLLEKDLLDFSQEDKQDKEQNQENKTQEDKEQEN